MPEIVMRDLQFAVGLMRRSPGFAALVLFTLAAAGHLATSVGKIRRDADDF